MHSDTSSAKVIVITGASDGIGSAAAQQLNQRGHEVVVVGRSPQKTAAVAARLGVNHFVADFTRLEDVRKLAAELDAAYPRIDVLANNAGGVFGDPTRTVDGFEKTFQINHLATFLLTSLLMEKLIESRATVIQTTTLHGGNVRKLDLDDLNFEADLDPIRAYNAAKLENVLFTKELHRRYHSRGLSAAVFNPGIVRTNFGSETTSRLMKFLSSSRVVHAMVGTPPEKGADQLVWLAEGTPGRDWVSGEFYVKRRTGTRLNRLAHDAELARGLWERSERLVD
jgi:NAD(P)-dependent dehydrogenase (short-subunit alcohol dehydrogenase family)